MTMLSPILRSFIAVISIVNLAFLFSYPTTTKTSCFRKQIKSNTILQARDSNSGAAMELTDVCVSIGNNDIISNINWQIMPRERWALVGPNGAGKSTLLKALTKKGEETLTVKGDISLMKKARIGYLEQKGVSGSTMTVKEEVTSRMDRLAAAKEDMEAAEKRVTEGDTSDEALQFLEEASIEFEAAGGFTSDQKISNVLKGLGFLIEDYDKLCNEFSGGWQMRIALARLLLSEPDVLILDEPTNHLDKGARNWLGSYLSNYDKTLLLVSHDVGLLETAVSSIAEVRGGGVELYKSRSYNQWQFEREERVKIAEAERERNIKEIERLQTFVDRFGAKTMGASMAQSRLKSIEKIEASMEENVPVAVDRKPPSLVLPKPPRGSQLLLHLKNAVISWVSRQGVDMSDSSEGVVAVPIIKKCDIMIERGMRIVVRGPNGAGKSTLLSALSGKLALTSGERILGDGLELGTFTQDLAQDLDQTQSAVNVVLNNVRQKDKTISDEKVRTVLGSLGLIKDKAVRLVGLLSGGEKARVALASFVLIPHNLLLLDEPSNHLDEQTLRVLTKALRNFEGSCLVISHDRQFLEELEPTHVITVRGGIASMEERGLLESDWEDDLYSRCDPNEVKIVAPPQQIQQQTQKSSSQADKKKNGKKNVTSDPSNVTTASAAIIPTTSNNSLKKPVSSTSSGSSSSGNDFKAVSKIESNIAKREKEMAVLDDEMTLHGSDVTKLNKLQEQKDNLQKKIDKLYAEYEALVS